MASAFWKNKRWYLLYKDSSGRWQRRASKAQGKKEAERLADDLERRHERARLGVEPLPQPDAGETVSELLDWWLKTYVDGTPSYTSCRYMVRRHLLQSKLAGVRLPQLTS